MTNFKKIYYVPGMISLIVLPILCIYIIKPYLVQERCIEVVFASNYVPHHDLYYTPFDTSILSEPGNTRKYFNIELNGNQKENAQKLNLFKTKVHELKENKDFNNGVHLIFQDGSTYANLVKSLDVCFSENIVRFMAYQDHLWVQCSKYDAEILKKRELNKKRIHLLSNDIIPKIKTTNVHSMTWISIIRKTWPIFVFLVVLFYLSIKKVI
jgi:hypothetical protein